MAEVKSLKGTKTEKNLLDAFAGESMARNKYAYYSSIAKKQGYVQISKIFEETANNEKEHAKMWFKLLDGISADTVENLMHAAEGENYEWNEMYPTFAKEAKEEGFDHISFLFSKVAEIEKEHEDRYKDLLQNIQSGQVFRREEKVQWHCDNCGYIVESLQAPPKCPVCDHSQAHFQIRACNW